MSEAKTVLDVAVAILRDIDGRVLINERLGDDMYTGHWEFPGGKFEPGESPKQALQRECKEELGIEIQESNPLITFTYAYPSKTVRLHVFCVENYIGQPFSLEGQSLRWVKIDSLNAHKLLPADVAIITALSIPEYCFVTPEIEDDTEHTNIIAAVIQHFARHDHLMLQVRQHHLSSEGYIAMVNTLLNSISQTIHYDKKLLIQANTCSEVFRHLQKPNATNIDLGLHLTANRLSKFKRHAVSGHKDILIGASVHTDEEIDLALLAGLDYVTLGMVKPSLTHPNRQALDWPGFFKLIKDRAIPVYAIGGMCKQDRLKAREYGAQGIAGIRMFLSAN